MVQGKVTIYYDYEPSVGVNATCSDWPFRNEYFSTYQEFTDFLRSEYGISYCLIQITPENYDQLCADGVFDV